MLLPYVHTKFHQPSLHTPVWCLRHLDRYFSPISCRPLHHSLVRGDLVTLGLLSVLEAHEDQALHLIHLFHHVLAAPQCRGRNLCSHCSLLSECQHSSGACAEFLLQNRVQCGIVTWPKHILWNSLIWTNCNCQNVSEQQGSAEIYIASGEPCYVSVKKKKKPWYYRTHAEGGTNPSGYFTVQCFKIVWVFSMCGDFPLLFAKDYAWQTRLYSQKVEVSRRQPLPVSVWALKTQRQ